MLKKFGWFVFVQFTIFLKTSHFPETAAGVAWEIQFQTDIVTGRNEVVAKVIFLHLSVILFTGGVCLSACWDAHPPGTRHHPPTPGTRHHHPPWDQTPPPRDQTPPGKLTPAYGLRAAGTHPTGMHSCLFLISQVARSM